MLRVLLLSRYHQLAASSRYRFYQYLPYLKKQGIEVTAAPLLDDYYLKSLYAKERKVTYSRLLKAYAQRLNYLSQASAFDVVWVQMEALPWIPSWLELPLLGTGTPYIVDYDDAWFHTYDQHPAWLIRQLLQKKIDQVMKNAAVVVAGNKYIAERAESSGAKTVEIIPTVIDLDAYPLSPHPENEQFTIGWIGTPFTTHHLTTIHTALQVICQDGKTQVVAIGDESFRLAGVNLHVKPWDQQTEVSEIQRFDLGIMPLKDSAFERGKCGLKLIQYMASARPVIATPVGVNQQIVKDGQNGFHATSTAQWLAAFERIKQDMTLRQKFGATGRAQVEKEYCLQVTAPKVAELLFRSAQGTNRS